MTHVPNSDLEEPTETDTDYQRPTRTTRERQGLPETDTDYQRTTGTIRDRQGLPETNRDYQRPIRTTRTKTDDRD